MATNINTSTLKTNVETRDLEVFDNTSEFAVISEGSIEYLSEIVGFNKYKYQTGDILLVKHYKKDINFIDRVERHSLPYDVVEKFDNLLFASWRPRKAGGIILVQNRRPEHQENPSASPA